MKTIKQKYFINASPEKVFQALTDPLIIKKWSGSNALMENKKGGKFELWDGWNYGTNTEIIKNKKLVQEWYSEDWEEASTVSFILHDKNGKTEVELIHEDVPDESFTKYSKGWEEHYLGAIREMFG